MYIQASGVNVVPILAIQSDDGNGYIIQPRAKGTELYDRHKTYEKPYVLEHVTLLSNAPQKHFDKFVADTIKIVDAGVIVDFIGKDNFFYDEAIGFQFVDLNAHFDHEYGLTDLKPQAIQVALWNCFTPCYFDTVPKQRDTVSKILSELTEKESSLLIAHNRIIFGKCKTAMLNNGISEEEISELISNERFIPQKQQLDLL